MKQSIFIYIALLFIFSSCLEQVNLDLPNGEPEIFVDAWITDEVNQGQVRIALTNAFDDQSEYENISDAVVYVMKNGVRCNLVYSDGFYKPNKKFVGEEGSRYQLYIEWEGRQIVSDEVLMRRNPRLIDQEVLQIESSTVDAVDPTDEVWYVRGVVEDLDNEDNFYRWQLIIDDQLQNRPEELILFNDRFTNGNSFFIDASNVLFAQQSKVQLKHMSLEESFYNYMTQLRDLTVNSATGPTIRRSALIGNLRDADTGEPVLGYFGASSVTTIDIQ